MLQFQCVECLDMKMLLDHTHPQHAPALTFTLFLFCLPALVLSCQHYSTYPLFPYRVQRPIPFLF